MDDRILVRQVDRVEKKNALTPKIARELAAGPARLDEDPDRFAGVLTFGGDHRTARLGCRCSSAVPPASPAAEEGPA